MPITPFQTEVFRIISANRSSESYIAGGVVIQRDSDSFRLSDDIDIFHDSSASVFLTAQADAKALREAGFGVQFVIEELSFLQALVEREGESIRLDWASDSAFRFFPIVSDEVLGFRLHDADAATNKILAAAGRQMVRDFIDLMQLDRTYISLGVAVWAASGKDEGFTPDMLMQELRRNSRINPASLAGVNMVHPTDAVTLKKEWLERFAAAERLIASIPPEPLGCLYLDRDGHPARGEAFDSTWFPHFGSVGGAWPRIME